MNNKNVKIARTLFVFSAFLFILALLSFVIIALYPGANETFGLVPFALLTLGGPLSIIGMLAFGIIWSVFASKRP